jgi:uncharacterized OsmC-like protein
VHISCDVTSRRPWAEPTPAPRHTTFFLLAALGACTSMTLAMYARRKKWPLEHVTVRLRHSREYAQDSARCETQDTRFTVIDREIELDGSLDDERARLLAIANRCPVHLTLSLEDRDPHANAMKRMHDILGKCEGRSVRNCVKHEPQNSRHVPRSIATYAHKCRSELCRNCVRSPRNRPTNTDVYGFTSRGIMRREVVESIA